MIKIKSRDKSEFKSQQNGAGKSKDVSLNRQLKWMKLIRQEKKRGTGNVKN